MLRARLLGPLEVELDGSVIDSPATQRGWALFAYLALAEQPVARAELANVFWPDVLDQSARASLRSALWTLRRQIGDRLVVDADHVGLDDGWIDVREFARLASEDPGRALELCRGEMLEGVQDEWVLRARDRHRERCIELLEQQARAAEEAGRLDEAIAATRRQVERDPLDEQAHQRLIRRLAGAGDRAGMIRTYRRFAERLRHELGVTPSAATRRLVEQLRAEPVVLHAEPSPAFHGLVALVGREAELAELELAWRRTAAGVGSTALVRGEAGIGKTRLATELRLSAGSSGACTAASAALDLGGTAPFSLWAELIRELLPQLPAPPMEASWPGDLAALVSELPAHFGRTGATPVALAPDLQRTRLFEAVVALVGWAARHAPLLLLLEDAHDADAPSLELAGYAARRLTQLPVMMLITRRELPSNAGADRLEHALRSRGLLSCELSLGPLAPAMVGTLARNVASLNDADVDRVIERAEGNALLAVETARALQKGHRAVAPSLRGSVRATLGPLSGDVRRLIDITAVAARPVAPAEIDLLSFGEAASDALQTGLLISDSGRIMFRHALLRDAAFEEIPEPHRRTLHRTWAQILSRSGRTGAEVAHHLRLAGDDLAAVPELVRAAKDARAVAALAQATAYLQQALAIAPERPDDWLELGELEAWRAQRDRAEEAFQTALSQLEGEDPVTVARAWLRRGRAYHGPICAPRAVLDSARNALTLLETDGSLQERSEALAALAWAEAVAGSVDEAERLLRELDDIAAESTDLRTYDVGHARAVAFMRRGQFSRAYGPSIAAGETISRAGRPDLAYGCWANAAAAAVAAREPERALEFLDRGVAALAGQGLQSLEIHLLAARSFVQRCWGRLEHAREAAEAEHALAEGLAQPDLLAMASHDRGLVALEAREYRSAVALLNAALTDQGLISGARTRLALAEALVRDGQPDSATEQIRATVLQPLRPSDFPNALVPALARVQGLVAQARGDRDEAERRLQESVAGWERLAHGAVPGDGVTSVLADLGRPVVGLIDPERELARAREDLASIATGGSNALIS